MKLQTLDDFDVKGKTVLVRSDLNSDVKHSKVVLSDRIRESAKTISELKRRGARVIVLAHQGREGKKDFISLKQHAALLSMFTKVSFVNDTIGAKALRSIEQLKYREALLLENVRFLQEEFVSGKNTFVKTFLPFVDIYINDAFSVAHRRQTSVTGFATYIKEKGIGRLMEKELAALEHLSVRNCLYILGGAKPADNIKLLGRGQVVATGLFDHLCLIAKGHKLGKQQELSKALFPLLSKIKKHLKSIATSIDFIIPRRSKTQVIRLEDLPSRQPLYDIGPQSVEQLKKVIRKHTYVFVKGPLGFFQKKGFHEGTVSILRFLAKHNGKVILGGGHLNTALEQYKISKKSFFHISLAGGALVRYLAGEKLVGLEALQK